MVVSANGLDRTPFDLRKRFLLPELIPFEWMTAEQSSQSETANTAPGNPFTSRPFVVTEKGTCMVRPAIEKS